MVSKRSNGGGGGQLGLGNVQGRSVANCSRAIPVELSRTFLTLPKGLTVAMLWFINTLDNAFVPQRGNLAGK